MAQGITRVKLKQLNEISSLISVFGINRNENLFA